MFIDSHCHLNFPELFIKIDEIRQAMDNEQVSHALCISVTLDKFPAVLALAVTYDNFYASVGVHPDVENAEVTVEMLTKLADHPKVIAIGETGLDYFRLTGDLTWQKERFRTHIRAAIQSQCPLVIHTRSAAKDTLTIMREEKADTIRGVMHCFTESADVAKQAMDMGFYISISGIVTFKNALELKEVVKTIPLDRLLIETDSPYLAPVPYRGKENQPAYVRFVAEEIARLKNVSIEAIATATTNNFFTLFQRALP